MRPIVSVLLVVLPGLLMCGDGGSLDDLLASVEKKPASYDLKQLHALMTGRSAVAKATLACVWYEGSGDWPGLASNVAVPLSKQRSGLGDDQFLIATCGEALARSQGAVQARTFLGQSDWSGSGAGAALGWAALGRAAVIDKSWDEALRCHAKGEAALKRSISDDGRGWMVSIARRRLAALHADIDRAKTGEVLGEDFLLWRQAEALADGPAAAEAVIEAYDKVVRGFPDGRFAGPSELEAARAAHGAGMRGACTERLKRLLARRDPQLHGFACILAADAELDFTGDVAAVRRASQEAIEWATSRGPAQPLPDAIAAAVQPTVRPHRFSGWNAPTWSGRERFRLWTWDAAPWAQEHVIYQAMVRLVIAALASGNNRQAIEYGQALTRLDPVDQEMLEAGGQSGPRILVAAIQGSSFFLPDSAWKELPAAARTKTLAALVWYQLYDWASARTWTQSALEAIRGDDPRSRDQLNYLLGFTWQGSHQREKALACWAKVGSQRQPGPFWALARLAEAGLIIQDGRRFVEAAGILMQVADRMPDSGQAEDALVRLVNAGEFSHPDLAAKAARRFLSSYPRSVYATFVSDVLARLTIDVAPPPKGTAP